MGGLRLFKNLAWETALDVFVPVDQFAAVATLDVAALQPAFQLDNTFNRPASAHADSPAQSPAQGPALGPRQRAGPTGRCVPATKIWRSRKNQRLFNALTRRIRSGAPAA